MFHVLTPIELDFFKHDHEGQISRLAEGRAEHFDRVAQDCFRP